MRGTFVTEKQANNRRFYLAKCNLYHESLYSIHRPCVVLFVVLVRDVTLSRVTVSRVRGKKKKWRYYCIGILFFIFFRFYRIYYVINPTECTRIYVIILYYYSRAVPVDFYARARAYTRVHLYLLRWPFANYSRRADRAKRAALGNDIYNIYIKKNKSSRYYKKEYTHTHTGDISLNRET